MAAGKRWPSDPNFALMVGICIYGLLVVLGFLATMASLITEQSPLHFGLLLVLPIACLTLVCAVHFGSSSIRFHPIMLSGCLVIVALALITYLQMSRGY